MENGMILNSLKIPNNDINDIINSNIDTTLCIKSNKPGLYEKVSSLCWFVQFTKRNGSRYLEPCLPLVH